MSKKNSFPQEYFRMRDGGRFVMAHEAVVDMMNGRPANYNVLDALNHGYGFVPEPGHFGHQFVDYRDSSDDDYDFDDKYSIITNSKYCGFPHNFLDRGLPKPSRHITPEEAEKNAKELLDEEERCKEKAEKKKQKKIRQKERRRLEKLEKENADKGKNKQVQIDPGSEKTKPADKDKNKIQNDNSASVPPEPPLTSAALKSSDSSDSEKDDEEEHETIEPEELDMNSCFVSNAAAIAKRKLEQKPKLDKKTVNPSKPSGSEQKRPTTPQKQNDNKVEAENDKKEETNDFITKSIELAAVGNHYAATGHMEMAVTFFTDAIKHNPKEYKLFGNRSLCYEKMQQFEKALTDAEIALSMNPKWIKGLYRKGKALVGLKRYYEARLTYSEVLKLDGSCKDAAEEMMRVQLMQLMELGYTKEQSSNALIFHGTVEKALEALSGQQGLPPPPVPRESQFMSLERNSQPSAKLPLRTLPQNQPRPTTPVTVPVTHHSPELFPIWVGDLVPSITDAKIYDLFRSAGPVHSVRVLPSRYCAFVNYIRKEDSEKAIRDFNGHGIDGAIIVVRYPDRIHTRLGVSRDASTESSWKPAKLPDECYFWRTTGCIKNERCTYRHIPENKGIDQHKGKSYP